MKYTKPTITKRESGLPPLTTNFAPPPVEGGEGSEIVNEVNNYKEGIRSKIQTIFGDTSSKIEDKRIPQSGKGI